MKKVKCRNCGRIRYAELGELINGTIKCYCGSCSFKIIDDEDKDFRV